MYLKLFLFACAAFWIKDSQALSPDAANFAKILIDASDLPEKVPSDAVAFAHILTETSEESAPTSFYKKSNEVWTKATRNKKNFEMRFRRFQAREELEI